MVSLTSEYEVFPAALAARTRSPTLTSAIALMSPDSSWTVSVPAKQLLSIGAYAGAEVGNEVLVSVAMAPADATKPSVAPTVFRELVRVGAELVREVVTDSLLAAVETE